MNLIEMLLYLIPVLGAIIVYAILHRNKVESDWVIGLVCAFIGILVVASVTLGSRYSATQDYEIINGVVVSKSRTHGTYEESYRCRCRMVTRTSRDSSGRTTTSSHEECDTCYRTHYTVEWDVQTQVGSYEIDSRDTLSRSVYDTPDPKRYVIVNKGDPVSRRVPYRNYIQAVPESLFAVVSEEFKKPFLAVLPGYPENIYDFYRVDRFLSPGLSFEDAALWNEGISKITGELGPLKQVNVIVVIAKQTDQRYALALQDHWDGANKNDVVVVIGSEDGKTINFATVLSWTKRDIFRIQLQDTIAEMQTIDRTKILQAVYDQIVKNFERRKMADFEYLKDSIPLPNWVIITSILIVLLGQSAAVWVGLSDRSLRRKIFR